MNQSSHGSPDIINRFNTSQDTINFSVISGLNSKVQGVTINFLSSAPTSIAAHTIDVVTGGGNTIVYANATSSSESISGHHVNEVQSVPGFNFRWLGSSPAIVPIPAGPDSSPPRPANYCTSSLPRCDHLPLGGPETNEH